MGCQTKIASEISAVQADYVLALKGNQESLHQAVIDYVDEQAKNDFADVPARRHVTKETGHGHALELNGPRACRRRILPE